MLYDLGIWGLIVTAPGDEGYDFVSRFFAPAKGVPEDPVTGSAHCALTPYWSQRLGKKQLKARQVSPAAAIFCVRMMARAPCWKGTCALYLTGEIEIALKLLAAVGLVRHIAQRLIFAVQAFACRHHRRCLRRTSPARLPDNRPAAAGRADIPRRACWCSLRAVATASSHSSRS